MKKFVMDGIVKPLLANPAIISLIFGVAFLFINALGRHINPNTDDMGFWHAVFIDVSGSLGIAIIGGGVVSVISNSAIFSRIFQRNLAEVFYNPSSVFNKTISEPSKELKQRWLRLTRSILKDALPVSHSKAAELILEQFMDDELEYHIENFEVCYDIEVNKATQLAKVTHTTKAMLVVAPKKDDPILLQKMKVGGDLQVNALMINGLKIDIDPDLKDNESTPGLVVKKTSTSDGVEVEFNLHLSSYIQVMEPGDDKKVSYERTYTYKQNILEENYIQGNLTRYAKGFKVRARITDGYRLKFNKTGFQQDERVAAFAIDGSGFSVWTLAGLEEGKLLMPGQGYIILVFKDSEDDGETI